MSVQIIILDFGSQYTQLIARVVRELGVYCEILPGNGSYGLIASKGPKAIILSGSPCSVRNPDSPIVASEVLDSGLPVLGICYGMQLIAHQLGGQVGHWESTVVGVGADLTNKSREYGPAIVTVKKPLGPFCRFEELESFSVWMSHGDKILALPAGFELIADSTGAPIAVFGDPKRHIYGVQFHPEVHHTLRGKEIIESFLFDIADVAQDWDSSSFIERTIKEIKDKIDLCPHANEIPPGDTSQTNVVCGLSGGVDSTVAAVLVNKAIGTRLHCIFVNNGLLREGEAEEVMESMLSLGLNVTMVDASEEFLSELANVSDPETKRKIIGRVFIEVFEKEARRISNVHYLVQGTLYPDVIESVSVVGKSQTIKSHHNVGGLIANMKLSLIEPLRELFKDEVRTIGQDLEIPQEFLMRQPFPGPGLAIRCVGEITKERLSTLRKADSIVREEIKNAGLERTIWQSFAILLPVRSVGVMGDERTFDEVIVIRAVTSRDGMTADWYYFNDSLLRKMSTRIVNETPAVNRVLLDISTKPPATIEWE